MKKIVLGLVVLLVAMVLICSCKQPSDISDAFTDAYPTLQPNKYNQLFRVGGYFIKYDGLHYKKVASSVQDVKEIIEYYYPDCFEVTVYRPGTPETNYLNIYFYATWKSYMGYVEIK